MDSSQETLFVIDDDPAVRASFAALAASLGLTSETFESAEAFQHVFSPQRPGCAIVDLRLPGMDGLELMEWLTVRGEGPPVVLTSAFVDVPKAVAAMHLGAVTVLLKTCTSESLCEAIHAGLERDRKARAGRRWRQDRAERLRSLSARERQVLELVVEDLPNRCIARRLGVSQRTVDRTRAAVYEKLGVCSAIEAARLVEANAQN